MCIRDRFYGEEGFRHFFTVKPVATIDDLKGMKLRVSNDPVMNGMVEGLGANPTVVSFGELYSALQDVYKRQQAAHGDAAGGGGVDDHVMARGDQQALAGGGDGDSGGEVGVCLLYTSRCV